MTMSSGDFINIYPTELKFPFELRKQSACSLQLSNKTDQYIAFKVKTTNPKKYCVRPNAGVVLPGSSCNVTGNGISFYLFLPGSSCNVTVTMQAQKEAPPDMQCKDKFLIQSVLAPSGTSNKEITTEMFNKEDGKVIDEFKLRVVYVPANPPSPVPEGSEEGGSPRASLTEDESKSSSLPEAVSRSLEEPKAKSSPSEELIRKEISKSNAGGFSMLFVVLVGLIGLLVGYLIKKT
ncbi:vesicle-associated protein 1-3 isoform X3 [Nicotiana tabacum]|uniref:Vesicle-associated protein 1-3 isoform X3 n=1 Tax=Nicotiana tabacum TaxID=4097 RepID=A0AC58TAR8_TOBAC|nr:vesicle-associated protein 1-3 isoform X3 [Nicotiana tomentosiformis]